MDSITVDQEKCNQDGICAAECPALILRMDAKEKFAKGGESGDAVKAKSLDDSLVYVRITLDEGDDDFMPAKGDPLSKEQVEIIKKWIEGGADFGKWTKSELDDEGKVKK